MYVRGDAVAAHLDEKQSWVVLSTVHERYSFETVAYLRYNVNFADLLNEFGVSNDTEVDIYPDGRIVVDSCDVRKINEYSYPDLDGSKVENLSINVWCAVPLEKLIRDDFAAFIWGSTNSKFGILDIKGAE